MTLRAAAARSAAVLFAAVAAFQAALALGAPWGRLAWGGAVATLPGALRASSALAAVYLVLAAAAMLVRSGNLGRRVPQRPIAWINAALCLQMALNSLANLASSSPSERLVMGSASGLGFALCLAALTARPSSPP